MSATIETTMKISTTTKDITEDIKSLLSFCEKRTEAMEGYRPDYSQVEIIATVKM